MCELRHTYLRTTDRHLPHHDIEGQNWLHALAAPETKRKPHIASILLFASIFHRASRVLKLNESCIIACHIDLQLRIRPLASLRFLCEVEMRCHDHQISRVCHCLYINKLQIMVRSISVKFVSSSPTHSLGVADKTGELVVHIEDQKHVKIDHRVPR